MASVADQDTSTRLAFGAWLIQQKGREGFIGQLAAAAAADRAFPRQGNPEDVRKRLGTIGADCDLWDALDDAELDWSSL